MKKTKENYLKDWKNILYYLLIFLAFMATYSIIQCNNGDNAINYWVAYNINKGLIPYVDFNLVTLPLAPLIISLIMNILGGQMIIYYALSALFMVISIYLVNKIDKTTTPMILYLMLIFTPTSYSCFILTLCLLLIYLEKNEKNDYLIGLVIGGMIMIKQTMALFIIPMLMIKNKIKIKKRIVGLLIPIVLIILYLLVNNALYNCINYTLLGLLDFGGNNSNLSIFTFVFIIVLIYNFYLYIKTKNLNLLYSLCFLTIAFPIFDMYHTLYGMIPFILLTTHSTGKTAKVVKLIFYTYTCLFLISNIWSFFIDDDSIYILDRNSNHYLTATTQHKVEHYEKIYSIYNKYNENYDVYFLFQNPFQLKAKYNIPINEFDLTWTGNNGYDGTNSLIEKIKKMDSNTVLFVHENLLLTKENGKYSQINYELIEFVINTYPVIEEIDGGYKIYQVINN